MSLKVKYAICKGECSKEEKAIYCKGMCNYCYWISRKQATKPKEESRGKVKDNKRYKIKNRSKKGQKIANDDSNFFRKIWMDRPHVSGVSGEYLGDTFNPCFFSHVLTKAAYPKARHWEDNIILMTFKEHSEWEFGDRSTQEFKKKFTKVLKRYSELIERYYKN